MASGDDRSNLCQSQKKAGHLEKFVKRLGRRSLEKLYLIYILPLSEYGGIIWNNCMIDEEEKLKSIQNRIRGKKGHKPRTIQGSSVGQF